MNKETIEEYTAYINNTQKLYKARTELQECAHHTCQDEINAKFPRCVINVTTLNGRFVMMLDFSESKILRYCGLNGWHIVSFDKNNWKECIDYEFK